MENLEAWILKVFGFALMVTSTLDFFGFIPLPKIPPANVPTVMQLGFAFAIGLGLLIIPLTTIQGWYNKMVGKKIDKQ